MTHITNHECVSSGCFRADRRVSTLTLGRMLTSTSIRSPTVLAFCSKLQLSSPSLCPLSTSHVCHVHVLKTPSIILSPSSFLGFLPSEEELPTPSALEEKVHTFEPDLCFCISLICWEAPEHLSIPPQQKQQELKRVEKWLKMVKNWDKYRNSEKVCEAFHPHANSVWPHFHLFTL